MVNPYPEFPEAAIYLINDYPGSGYQAQIIVSWKPKMSKTFADIRFHDDLGTIIPYWIESQTDGSTATVWIKLTSSKIVTLRWGNGSAVSESNGTNVFELFDSFENTTILTGASGTPAISYVTGYGGVGYAVQVDGGNAAHEEMQSTVSISRDNVFEVDIKIPSAATNPSIGGVAFGLTAGTNNGYQCITDSTSGTTSSTADMQIRVNASSSAIVDYEYGDIQKDVWYKIQVKWLSTGVINYNLYDGDTLFGNASGTPSTVYTTGVCGLHSYSKTIFDNFRVRKYLATEPTFTLISSQYIPTFPYEILESENSLIYPIIQFTEDNEMNQPPGTSLDWLVQIRDPTNGSALVTESLTGVSVYYTINKSTGVSTAEAEWTPAPTISAYSNNLTGHLITVPSAIGSYTFVDGDSLIAIIDSDQGTGAILVNFRTPEATHLTDIQTAIWAATTRELTAVPTGGALTTDITALNNLSSSDVTTATASALSASNALRILDIIMSGTFTITAGEGGAFTCTYTSRTDLSTIEFSVDGNGQRTAATVTLV